MIIRDECLGWPLAAYGKIIRGDDTTSEDQVAEACTDDMARRIAICVNACAGMSNKELEGGILLGVMEKRIAELEQQRDKLLAALNGALEKMKAAHESMFEQCLSNPVSNAWGKEINLSAINELQLAASRIDSAIAKTKGGEA